MSYNDWRVLTLEEIADVKGGKRLPKGESLVETPNDHPYIRVSDMGRKTINKSQVLYVPDEIFKSITRYIVDEGDIILSIVGTIGLVSVITPELNNASLTENCVKVTNLRNVLKEYLYYYLVSDNCQNEIRSKTVGTTQPKLPLYNINSLQIPVPPLPTQRRIADILSALDEKIELNRQTNATLETMAREMFKSWFIDFEPVYAKANGHTPLSLKPEIANLFPDTFQKTELGDIPINWEVMTVDEITERVAMGPFGSSIKVETFVDEGIPIISGQHLRGFMLKDSTYKYISLEHAEKLKKANVYRGDVIFTHAGNIENLAFIPEDSQYSRYVVSQRQFYVRCNLEKVTPTFITFYFQSPTGQHKLLANKSPVGVPSIAQPVSYLRLIKLPIPPKPILDEFERVAAPLLQKYQANVHESQTLINLRDTLLPKLMSGKIEV